MAPRLTHDEFFDSLASLLSSTSQKARGSVFLTQKRLSAASPLPTTQSTPAPPSSSSPPSSILIRVTDGNTNTANPKPPSKVSSDGKAKRATPLPSSKIKISTVVALEELEAFYARYAEICKAGMTGLKKRDRKKGKAKGKAAGAKAAKA